MEIAVRGLIASHRREFMTGGLCFFHILKVSNLERRGKRRHFKKSSLKPAGLKPKTLGTDTLYLLHEMCWMPSKMFL
jgi:hypothetical protein